MAAFHPRVEDLPGEFPVFPLSGRAALAAWQTAAAHLRAALYGDDRGCARPRPHVRHDPAGPDAGRRPTMVPALYRVGCLGRLSSFNETDEGHYLITLTGLARFAVAAELEMRRGYRRVRGDFSPYRADLDLAPRPIGVERESLADDVAQLLHPSRVRRQLGRDQAAAGRYAGRDACDGLSVRAGREAGPAGGARRSRPCRGPADAVADGRAGARHAGRPQA